MEKSSRVSGFVVSLVITALAAAPLLAGTGGGMTTADLALQLAQAAGMRPPANESPQMALESLGKAGIDLGSDLKAPVTEKTLVQVGLSLGVRVSTSHPEAPATPVTSGALIRAVKSDLERAAAVSGQSATDSVNASCQGRESRAGRQGTPASPSSFNATAGPCGEPPS